MPRRRDFDTRRLFGGKGGKNARAHRVVVVVAVSCRIGTENQLDGSRGRSTGSKTLGGGVYNMIGRSNTCIHYTEVRYTQCAMRRPTSRRRFHPLSTHLAKIKTNKHNAAHYLYSCSRAITSARYLRRVTAAVPYS